MLRSASELKGYTLGATDGEVGAVEEFYFDDERWTVRYLVADTGKWIPDRKVLISPFSLGRVSRDDKTIQVNLTRDQVKNSPDVDTHAPMSRAQEIALLQYYGYPYYWVGPYAWGPGAFPEDMAVPPAPVPEAEEAQNEIPEEDIHLKSTREVTGYAIEATDGEIGNVKDFILDDESWAIRYLVVDTGNWLPGKKVLVAPGWIHEISWRDSKVYVNLSRETIENSPEYDPSKPLTRDYESELHTHYDRPRYWND